MSVSVILCRFHSVRQSPLHSKRFHPRHYPLGIVSIQKKVIRATNVTSNDLYRHLYTLLNTFNTLKPWESWTMSYIRGFTEISTFELLQCLGCYFKHFVYTLNTSNTLSTANLCIGGYILWEYIAPQKNVIGAMNVTLNTHYSSLYTLWTLPTLSSAPSFSSAEIFTAHSPERKTSRWTLRIDHWIHFEHFQHFERLENVGTTSNFWEFTEIPNFELRQCINCYFEHFVNTVNTFNALGIHRDSKLWTTQMF